MRLLVTGGRSYQDREYVWSTLDSIRPTLVLCGGASGADRLASDWARAHNVPVEVFPADWKTHGRAAGPIRNQQMLDEGRPDIVLAFPGGPGTHDMSVKAALAGIPIFMPQKPV